MAENEKVSKSESTSEQAGIICPQCYNLLKGYSLYHCENDKYGRNFRNYMGWCSHCDIGFEVVQFLFSEKWYIHKYRYYAAVVPDGKQVPDSNWKIENCLPAPAPVVTGPGGDYVKPFDPAEINIDAIKTMLAALKAAAGSIECLLHVLLDKKSEKKK